MPIIELTPVPITVLTHDFDISNIKYSRCIALHYDDHTALGSYPFVRVENLPYSAIYRVQIGSVEPGEIGLQLSQRNYLHFSVGTVTVKPIRALLPLDELQITIETLHPASHIITRDDVEHIVKLFTNDLLDHHINPHEKIIFNVGDVTYLLYVVYLSNDSAGIIRKLTSLHISKYEPHYTLARLL